MVDAGFITRATRRSSASDNPRAAASATSEPAARNYFADWVMDEAAAAIIGTIDRDIVVETTLDPTLQSAAERRVDRDPRAARAPSPASRRARWSR